MTRSEPPETARVRVGYLTSQYPAPSHTFIRREVVALRERGVDVRTFSIRPPAASERLSPEDQREHHRTWYVLPARPLALVRAHLWAFVRSPSRFLRTLRDAQHHRVPGLRAFVWAFFHFFEAMLVAEELHRQGITHLHNHFANPSATVGYLASRYLGLAFSLTIHGISEFDYPAGVLLPEKVEHASFVACVSHFGRAQAMRITSSDAWSKMQIVRCGLTLEGLPERKRRDGPVRMLTVGRLSPEKGQLGLLEAFASATAGTDVELRIVGGGPLEAAIAQRIEALGLQDRCVLLGQLPNDVVLAELAESDLFVLPSLMEGLPVVLMEAMALEVPVIAPWIAGIPELVEHGRNGLLFRPGDWEHLAERIQELVRDGEARARFGTNGADRVRAEFDVRIAIEPLLVHFGVEQTTRAEAIAETVSSPLRVGFE